MAVPRELPSVVTGTIFPLADILPLAEILVVNMFVLEPETTPDGNCADPEIVPLGS